MLKMEPELALLPNSTMPIPSTFVVLEFDPVDTASHLHNSELTEACRQLRTQKYVGYADTPLPNGLPWVAYHLFKFHFLHKGIHQTSSVNGLESAMCTPVLPNNFHPSARPPVVPGKPLPWDHCYISSCMTIDARCRPFPPNEIPSNLVTLNGSEAGKLHTLITQDVSQALQCKASNNSEQGVTNPKKRQFEQMPGLSDRDPISTREDSLSMFEDTLFDPSSHAATQTPMVGKVEGGYTWSAWITDDEDEGFTDDEDGKLANDDSSELEVDPCVYEKMVVKVSFDLSEVDGVNDPEAFYREIEAFKRLRDELHGIVAKQSGITAFAPPSPETCALPKGDIPSVEGKPAPKHSAMLRAKGAQFLRNVRETATKSLPRPRSASHSDSPTSDPVAVASLSFMLREKAAVTLSKLKTISKAVSVRHRWSFSDSTPIAATRNSGAEMLKKTEKASKSFSKIFRRTSTELPSHTPGSYNAPNS